MVQKAEEACRKSNVECVRVDGSCTVPPVKVLRRRASLNSSGINYDGVPSKAYMWQNKTEFMRAEHLSAANKGFFDAPELLIKMEDQDMFSPAPDLNEVTKSSSNG